MRTRRHRRGFSMVEMVAALLIFSISVVAALEVYALCIRGSTASLDVTRAGLLAQGVMEQTLAEGNFLVGTESGELAGDLPGAAWAREVQESDTAGLYEVRVTVTYEERGKQEAFELTTLAAQR